MDVDREYRPSQVYSTAKETRKEAVSKPRTFFLSLSITTGAIRRRIYIRGEPYLWHLKLIDSQC